MPYFRRTGLKTVETMTEGRESSSPVAMALVLKMKGSELERN